MAAGHWDDAGELRAEQEAVGRLRPAPWHPPPRRRPLLAVGVFVAYLRGEQGPGRTGDRAWVGVATWSEEAGALDAIARPGRAGARYEPGLLAAREAPMILEPTREVLAGLAGDPVLLVDGTGRDHPRRAGLAVHLGWLLDVPTVGVTHRPLVADRSAPAPGLRGDHQPIDLDGGRVAAWVCTSDGARPIVAHAGWRTDAATAVEVVVRTSTRARTPEPLRLARQLARTARSHLAA